MKRLRAMLPLLLLLTTGIVLLATGMTSHLAPSRLVMEHAMLLDTVQQRPWLSRIAYIGLLTLVTSTGIPGSLLVIVAGGMVFGEIEGTVLSSISLMLGSLLLFLASRYAFGCGCKPAPRLVERLRHGYVLQPLSYTFFLRLVPVFPFGAITVALAWLCCPLWLFLLATLLGGSVMLIFETAIGANLGRNLAAGESIGWHLLLDPHMLLPLGVLAFLAILPVIIRHRRRPRHDSQVIPPQDG